MENDLYPKNLYIAAEFFFTMQTNPAREKQRKMLQWQSISLGVQSGLVAARSGRVSPEDLEKKSKQG